MDKSIENGKRRGIGAAALPVFLLVVAGLLAGCANTKKFSNPLTPQARSEMVIADVEVLFKGEMIGDADEADKTEILQKIDKYMRQEFLTSRSLSSGMRNARLSVTLEVIQKGDPAQAILIGAADGVSGRMDVIDIETSEVVATYDHLAGAYAVSGLGGLIAGAILDRNGVISEQFVLNAKSRYNN